MMPPLSVNTQIAKWRSNPEFAVAYDALEEEFALAAQRIDVRDKKGSSQTKPKVNRQIST